ncbi:MAG: DMT family transporter [Desulfobacterales bacterium]|nr:MAG: DMT family transporter [Desulfobacterales bacterium]
MFWLPFLAFSIRAKRLDSRVWRRALLPAAANIVMQSLWATAFYYVDPAFMVLLTKTNIIWIAAFSFICFPEERGLIRSGRFWLGLVLVICGVVGVLYSKEDFAATGTTTGVLITLACAFMWGVYTVSVRMAFRDIDSRSGFSAISIYTVAGLAVFGLAFGDLGDCAGLGAEQWVVVILSAILCIALAHVLYYTAMRRIGATIPALVVLAQPAAVLAISHFVFGESMKVMQLGFGAVLLLGAGLAIWAQKKLSVTRQQ